MNSLLTRVVTKLQLSQWIKIAVQKCISQCHPKAPHVHIFHIQIEIETKSIVEGLRNDLEAARNELEAAKSETAAALNRAECASSGAKLTADDLKEVMQSVYGRLAAEFSPADGVSDATFAAPDIIKSKLPLFHFH